MEFKLSLHLQTIHKQSKFSKLFSCLCYRNFRQGEIQQGVSLSPSLADDVDPSAALASTPGHGLQLQCFPFSIPWYTDATCLPQPFQVNLPHLLHSTL